MRSRFPKIFLEILFLSALLPYAAAQQNASGGSTGNTNVPRTPARPSIPQPPPVQQVPPQPAPQMVFLSGNVVREDGSAPPYGAVIELDCAGKVTREATVSVNGRFSFQLGGENRFGQVFADASQGLDSYSLDSEPGSRSVPGYSGGTTQRSRRILGCEVRAQLAGYRSTSLMLNQEPTSGQNEIGTIVVFLRERVQGNMVSLTTLMAPKSAKKSVERARKEARKEHYAEAEELFRSAIQEYPKYAEALFSLGMIHERNGKNEEADKAYRDAIAADQVYVKPYVRLAQLEAARQNWREAASLTEKVLTLDPVTLVDAYFLSALANLNLGELELAEDRARHGQRMDFSNHYPQFYLILANIFAARQDSAGSIRELRSYLKSAPNASNASLVRSKLEKLEEQSKEAGQ